MTKIIWFNIGQKGNHNVTWQTGIIDEDFDPQSIKFQDCIWDKDNNPKTIYVKKEELSFKLHKSVEMSFKDLNQVAKWVKESYLCQEDIYVGNRNWVHIYDVFDMDNKNKWGYGTIVDQKDWK